MSHYNHTIHVAVIRRVTKILRYFAPSPCNNIKRNETTKICDHVKGNSHYRGLLSITTDCNQSINIESYHLLPIRKKPVCDSGQSQVYHLGSICQVVC